MDLLIRKKLSSLLFILGLTLIAFSLNGYADSPVIADCPKGTTGIPPNCVKDERPVINWEKYPAPIEGYSTLRIKPKDESAEDVKENNKNWGEFRIDCATSHMSNDDPLVYPNKEGASHSHTFFGNTSVKYNTDLSKLPEVGNSTCKGGIMNRSGYWVPTMVDTATNLPITPSNNIVYYKSDGYSDNVAEFPKGLRMIAGNAASTSEQKGITRWTCSQDYSTRQTHIPVCSSKKLLKRKNYATIDSLLYFPSCWDGVNLDSLDHKSHMSYPTDGPIGVNCPETHPVHIPTITYNIHYKIPPGGDTSTWRLASDNYQDGYGGYSLHGDYAYGWSDEHIEGIVKNCLKRKVDCHAHLLGDGRQFY